MEYRIDRIEERLRAMSGALRLRGIWPEPDQEEPEAAVEVASPQVLRLRERSVGDVAG